MATKTFEELKQLAIQIRDEKTNKQNTATRVGTAMLEHINKLEQDYYDKTKTDEELKERDDKLTELGKYIENEEYIRAYLDANDKFLWGIRKDGTVEWDKGIPSPVRKALIDLESKLVNENIKDLQNDINAINEQINTINQTFFYTEDEEFIHSVVDSEGNLLFGITKEGKPYYPNNETYHVVENEEFLAAWVDIRNNILFGIKWDGRLYTPTLDFSNELSEIAKLVTAKQDKLVSGQNIKTINGVSVLGEGNIQIEGASGAGVDAANLFLSSEESEEFLNVLVDRNNKILSCTKNYFVW